ncbi:hypothetical protein VNO80_24707 [Phaseolus coccineus]|uniref:Uncharacterized protein n=1 Tax=Phaseolus coccineus TaxID=3886 RepID=A0AAN9LY32_PHACN
MSGAGQTYWGIEQWMLLFIAYSYALCLIVLSEKCSVNDKVSVSPGLRLQVLGVCRGGNAKVSTPKAVGRSNMIAINLDSVSSVLAAGYWLLATKANKSCHFHKSQIQFAPQM